MSKAVVNQLNLVASDPERSIAFFRLLGVEIEGPSIWRTASGVHHASATRRTPGETGAEFDFDIDSVRFAAAWNAAWNGRTDLAGKVVIGVGVATRDDVDAAYARAIGAGHRGLQPPHDAFWGARYAIVEGPDGIAVGLMSPVSDAHRSAPPAV